MRGDIGMLIVIASAQKVPIFCNQIVQTGRGSG